MDKWNEICFAINKLKERNSQEKYFQVEVEHIFEKLGWSRRKDEILSEYSIDSGVSQVRADIVLQDEQSKILVVELKRPNQPSLDKHIRQLSSYMKLLKLEYGLFIGDTLQLFYDDPNDKEEPIKIFETTFHENNNVGNEFIKLLEKQRFDREILQQFCEDLLEQETDKKIALALIEELKSDDGVSKILSYLREDLSNDYNENIVKNVLENLLVKVDSRNSNESFQKMIEPTNNSQEKVTYTTGDKLPIEIIPNDVDDFKRQFLELGYAKLCYHYKDGSVKEKIWNKRAFSENANLKANLRSRPEARKGKWKEMGIVKLVCKVDNL